MDAPAEIKQALVHLRKVQTWFAKNTDTGSTLTKKLTWPEEAKQLGLNSKKMYSYLDILHAVYEHITMGDLLDEEKCVVKLDKKLQKVLKTKRTQMHIYEIASFLQ
jgi:hypothetical protein